MFKKSVILSLLVLIAIFGAAALYFGISTTPKEKKEKSAPPPKEEPTVKVWETTKGDTDIIKVFSPEGNESITSPLIVEGKARGIWFFEGDFPVVLADWDGKIIVETYAMAQGEWMTEEYVPFRAEIDFESPVFPGADAEHFSRRGYLILQKNNPSDLREYDDSLEIPIRFGD